jgi:hypothetical protein
MPSKMIADLVVKVGEYERNGERKSINKNIGTLMENDDGRQFVLIDSTVLTMELNYIANKDRREKMIVSVFPKRDEDSGEGQQRRSNGGGGSGNRTSGNGGGGGNSRNAPDDDIPF